jgi:hypothetical protein
LCRRLSSHNLIFQADSDKSFDTIPVCFFSFSKRQVGELQLLKAARGGEWRPGGGGGNDGADLETGAHRHPPRVVLVLGMGATTSLGATNVSACLCPFRCSLIHEKT